MEWPQLQDVRGLVVSAAGFNLRSPSSIPQRAEYTSVNSSDIVNPLLTTNDGRGKRPNLTIWSASFASAKTREHGGSIS